MRAALYLLAIVALLPYVLLATAFVLLDQAIGSGSLWALLGNLLAQFLWLVPWGILGFVSATIGLAALGLIPRTRWLGGLSLCLIALASMAILVFKGAQRVDISELIVLVPCIAVAAYGSWIACDELRARRASRGSVQARA